MAKKGIFFIVLVILAVVVGGFFYYQEYIKETPPEDWGSADISAPENYVVKEGVDGQIIENKKEGLRFSVPEGWTIEGLIGTRMEGSVIQLFSPGSIEKDSIEMEKGCRISIDITHINTNIETLKKEIQENSIWFSFIKTMEPIKINNKEGLRFTAESLMENFKFYRDEVILLVENKTHSLALDTTTKEEKNCSKEFEKFLESVFID